MILAAISVATVANLDAASFEQLSTPTFIKFFAPWCGHCKALAPKFEKMSDEFTQANLAQVDCTVEKELCNKHGIHGYPALKLFLDGKLIDYDGPREQGDMQLWVQSWFRPLLTWTTEAELAKEMETNHKTTYFYLKTEDFGPYEERYAELKGKMVIGAIKAQEDMLYANREGRVVRYDGDLQNVTAVKSFVAAQQVALFTNITPNNFGQLIRAGPVMFLYGKEEAVAKQLGELMELAREQDAPYNLGYMVYNDAGKSFMGEFKVDPEEPHLLLINFVNNTMNKYAYSGYDRESGVKEQTAKFWKEYLGKSEGKDEL